MKKFKEELQIFSSFVKKSSWNKLWVICLIIYIPLCYLMFFSNWGKGLNKEVPTEIFVLDKYRNDGKYYLTFEIPGKEKEYKSNNHTEVDVKKFKTIKENTKVKINILPRNYKQRDFTYFIILIFLSVFPLSVIVAGLSIIPGEYNKYKKTWQSI